MKIIKWFFLCIALLILGMFTPKIRLLDISVMYFVGVVIFIATQICYLYLTLLVKYNIFNKYKNVIFLRRVAMLALTSSCMAFIVIGFLGVKPSLWFDLYSVLKILNIIILVLFIFVNIISPFLIRRKRKKTYYVLDDQEKEVIDKKFMDLSRNRFG